MVTNQCTAVHEFNQIRNEIDIFSSTVHNTDDRQIQVSKLKHSDSIISNTDKELIKSGREVKKVRKVGSSERCIDDGSDVPALNL